MDFMDKIVADLQPKDQVNVETDKIPQVDEVDKLLNDLLTELDAPNTEPTQPAQPEPVLNEPKVEEPKVEAILNEPDVEKILDNNKLSLEERQEIIKYIDELSDENIKIQQDSRVFKVERDQLEQLLEKERARAQEFFDRAKELEREQKKIQSSAYPTDLSGLVDYYKLTKENPSIYNKQNLVAQAAKVIEQITERPMDDYILGRLSK